MAGNGRCAFVVNEEHECSGEGCSDEATCPAHTCTQWGVERASGHVLCVHHWRRVRRQHQELAKPAPAAASSADHSVS